MSDATEGGAAVEQIETQENSREGRQTTRRRELVCDDLVLGYPTAEVPIIDGETIQIPSGEVTALIGPNGSGKSTLLRGLSSQLQPNGGAVLLDGRDVQRFGTKELARKLGLLSQENEAPESLSVEQLAYYGRYPHRGFFESVSDADVEAVEAALELAGVKHLRDRAMGSLSGGQKQLAWIAMVLAQETDVLLLDEPTTYLDMRHQLTVMGIVGRLNREGDQTIVVVLHDINQAARYADYVFAMQDGSIAAQGTPGEIVTEELLANVFGVEARVTYDDTNEGPYVLPLRAID